LTLGETFQLHNSFEIEVTAIDSVTLSSGEKRKRLKMSRIPATQSRYWVEGIGSNRLPFNPTVMFVEDIYAELLCFYDNNNLQFGLGECQSTSVNNITQVIKTISCYPNPSHNEITISADTNHKMEKVEIFGINGKSILLLDYKSRQSINIDGFESGLYTVSVTFHDGSTGVTRFIKSF